MILARGVGEAAAGAIAGGSREEPDALVKVAGVAVGVLVAGTAVAGMVGVLMAWRVERKRVKELQALLDRMERLRKEERTGRVRAEQRLRQQAQDLAVDDQAEEVDDSQAGGDPALAMRAIGVVRSPFADRRGTPRQPRLCPDVPGLVVFDPRLQPELAVRELEQYSHAWVVFHFHLNTNAHRGAANDPTAWWASQRPLIQPPALAGAHKVGCLACRSPHRPNPIGLSLVRIVAVSAAGIAIAGHDLVDGTPVLDIKPYLPHVEAVQDATLPAWVDEENTLLAMSVDWLPAALDQLAQSCTHLPSKIPWRHPATPAQASATLLRRQIDQILRFDIRNLNQRQRAAPETTYHLRYAGLNLAYHIQDRRITIHACSLSSTSD